MRDGWKKVIIATVILVLLYVLLGNARSVEPNPFILGATIAVNMIVPVLGGLLFGKRVGFAVGILGTFLNALTPAGSIFEFLAIVPHGLMGLLAGFLKERFGPPIPSMSLVVGHLLNIIAFISFGVLPSGILSNIQFWYGVAFEAFIGIIVVIVISAIYRMGFEEWL